MKKLLLLPALMFAIIRLSAQNQPPVAINDYANITNCDTVTIYPLINDYDPEGDSIWIMNLFSSGSHLKWGLKTYNTISILMRPDFYGTDSIQIRIASRDSMGTTQYAYSWIYLNIQNCHCVDSVNVNNINARINNNGNLFWDFIGTAKFEVPKGSGKHTIFNSTLWLAGLDSIDTLHVAAERYEQDGHDFWAGPVSNIYDSAYDAKWNHLWKIKKSDIDYHLAHCWQPGYVPAQVLLDWPANGDTTLGQQKITAPFYDWNHDGIYDPYAGDYPLIKGDEAVYFIYNDDRLPHTESLGKKLGMEIHGMAYAFACNEDSALWNTLFINYKIYNRSQNSYHETYLGTFTDTEIGDYTDDYIGCDVQRGSFYGYNGTNVDGTGQSSAYGNFPPAQSVTFLAGPYMCPDGIDNPSGMCDNSVNGFNFGNNVIDDERLGLSIAFFFSSTYPFPDDYPPLGPTDYYNWIRGRFKDSTEMQWGGNAHAPGSGVCGPTCNFMFPANSDSCNWGTQGIAPNCTPYWTEETVANAPADRRGLGSSGPFTFEKGSVEELDLAYVFGRNFVDSTAWGGVAVMQERIDSIRKYFVNDSTPCGLGFSGISNTQLVVPQIKIFPNPAVGYITVDAAGMLCDLNYVIYDILGREVTEGTLKCTSTNQIYISGLQNGMYIINVSDGKKKVSRKFIKQ